MRRVLALALAASACGRIGFVPIAGSGDDDGDGGGIGDDGGGGGGDGGDGGDGSVCVGTAILVTDVSSVKPGRPRFAWSGNKAGISYVEDPTGTSTARFQIMTLAGAKDPLISFGVAGPNEDVHVAWDGAWRLGWSDNTGGDREILRSIDGTTTQAVTADTRADIALAFTSLGGGITGQLWCHDAGGSGFDRTLAVVNAAGTKTVNDLVIGASTLDVTEHDIVWTGIELGVFYSTPTALLLQRLMPNGTLIGGPSTVAITNVANWVTAGWAQDHFLVAWIGPPNLSLQIASVAADGTVLTTVAAPVPVSGFSSNLHVAIGATSDLVMIHDIDGSLHVIPVQRDGTLGPVTDFTGVSGGAVAWVGTGWALAVSRGSPDRIELLLPCP